MKYRCWFKHETHSWNRGYTMSTDCFVVKSGNKEKAVKKAQKKIQKWNKKCIGDFTLTSVDEVEEK